MKCEAASDDVIQQYQQFASRLLADETDLYRKRLCLVNFRSLYVISVTCKNVHVQNFEHSESLVLFHSAFQHAEFSAVSLVISHLSCHC